jgi:hypothetical protein
MNVVVLLYSLSNSGKGTQMEVALRWSHSVCDSGCGVCVDRRSHVCWV